MSIRRLRQGSVTAGRTRQAHRSVAHDACAFISKVEESSWAKVARHESEGAQQQQHRALRDAAAAVLAQQRKNGA